MNPMNSSLNPVPIAVPILETERLRLRGYRLEDFPARAKLWANPEVVRHITGTPMGEADVWARMLTLVGHWTLMGFGYWAVEEKASGRFVGEIGFSDFKREVVPSFAGVPELGWVLDPAVHGKGYATEGARAALAWGDGIFPGKRTVAIITPANAPSIRVAEKLGYREYARTTFRKEPIVLFERSRDGGR